MRNVRREFLIGGAGRDALFGGSGRGRCVPGATRDRARKCEDKQSLCAETPTNPGRTGRINDNRDDDGQGNDD